jgi:hypothetical protein
MTNETTARIRLACAFCDREDCDGITEDELAGKVDGGWESITERQTYQESIQVYDDPAEAPPDYSVFDWWTHVGYCPDCLEDLKEDAS